MDQTIYKTIFKKSKFENVQNISPILKIIDSPDTHSSVKLLKHCLTLLFFALLSSRNKQFADKHVGLWTTFWVAFVSGDFEWCTIEVTVPRNLIRTSKPQFMIITWKVQNHVMGVSDYLMLTVNWKCSFLNKRCIYYSPKVCEQQKHTHLREYTKGLEKKSNLSN